VTTLFRTGPRTVRVSPVPLTTTVCPFLCTGTAFVLPGSVTVSVMFFGAPFRSRS